MKTSYGVTLAEEQCSRLYPKEEYWECVHYLKRANGALGSAPGEYVDGMHHFVHLSIIAFYRTALLKSTGLMNRNFADFLGDSAFKKLVPGATDTFSQLNSLRIRVAHPVDRTTTALSKPIRKSEVEFLVKALRVAFQEFFDVWTGKLAEQVSTAEIVEPQNGSDNNADENKLSNKLTEQADDLVPRSAAPSA
jgi:hypothetical protein